MRRGNDWRLRDVQGVELSLKMVDQQAWQLLAISGGQPIRIFGEWSGNDLRVLSAWTDSFHSFAMTP